MSDCSFAVNVRQLCGNDILLRIMDMTDICADFIKRWGRIIVN